MKRISKKGFTLIELLAVIIILGVLLLIAVPSISKYITNSRIDTYKTNLLKIVDEVRNKVNSYSGDYSFKTNEYLIVPISCVELEKGSNTKSPFGEYIKENSFIAVTRNNKSGFNCYVAAKDESGYGMSLTNVSSNFNIIGNPGGNTIKEDFSVAPKKYKLEGNLPSDFIIETNGKTGNLVTCDAYKKVMYGDVNNDNDVNNKDLGLLRRYLNDWEPSGIMLTAADLNDNDVVNDVDLWILRKYLNGWYISFPIDSGNEYNIIYELDGGTISSLDKNPAYYSSIMLPFEMENPIKEGYIFLGWTGSNGDVPQTNLTIPEGTIGNLEYIANWESN